MKTIRIPRTTWTIRDFSYAHFVGLQEQLTHVKLAGEVVPSQSGE